MNPGGAARRRSAPGLKAATLSMRGIAAGCLVGALVGCSSAAPGNATQITTQIATVAAVPTPQSRALARYVSIDGDDHGPGTRQHPWRTLGYSLSKLYAGQVLFVHGGVYREVLSHVDLHHGLSSRPIAVTNVPGEVPVLKGVVALHRPAYWTINGLDVTWDPHLRKPPLFMVKITGGVGWSWNNSEFWGSRGAANVFVAGSGTSEPRDWSMTGNCVHGIGAPPRSGTSTNVMLGGMVDPGRGTFSRNVIFNRADQENLTVGSGRGAPADVDISYNTIYGGRDAVTVRGGPRHVQITRNLLGGASSDVLIGFDLTRSPGTVVSQNYGLVAPRGRPGAERMMRPAAEALIGGPGNVVGDVHPHFAHAATCRGFRTRLPALSPYGWYGL